MSLVLPRGFYANTDCALVAQQLLGKTLVVEKPGYPKRVGRIVETEAYLGPHDLAAHSSKGITPRTQIMFGEPGYAYVYLIYGMHHCLNVVTGPLGSGAAVLLRALEPVAGIQLGTHGPGRLTKAIAVDRTDNGQDLCGSQIYIEDNCLKQGEQIASSPRIGVDYAKEWAHALLRFYIQDNPFVSKPPRKKAT